MSNRTKIKPPKMTASERGAFYDRLCCCIAFVNTIAIDQIEVAVRKMRNSVREEELLWNVKLCRTVDDIDHIVKKMIDFLASRTRHCRVCTAPWLITYERLYIDDQRIVQGVQHLARRRIGTYMEDIRVKAATVCLNSGNKMSTALMQEALVATSWVRIVQKLSNYWIAKWKAQAGKSATIQTATLFLHQMRGISKTCDELSQVLNGLDYDAERAWWKQYHQSEDTLLGELIHLLDSPKFNDLVSEHMTKDWTDYYIGCTAREAQQTGEINDAVKKEIAALGEKCSRKILQPFVTMINAIAKKVETTDDIYDFVDYLDEHPWQIRETLYELAMRVAYPNYKST